MHARFAESSSYSYSTDGNLSNSYNVKEGRSVEVLGGIENHCNGYCVKFNTVDIAIIVAILYIQIP